ncbi:glycoside hydrolase family 38 C-terminal domain-containing protein [Saccharibacillus sp. CPCC 101409]|uniref:alpha-mannosidase n=1 Tax=Saccharibacillus sp. CPCC 101409 TaxID=3058041 RepID=UPI002671570B|nr:glycoside hydrolase family 38 C-terminal domain-containing protein [Saccharibacillus sp. CPCC 101409]MDO3413364.1 glycoside hydrolase family 38 C-terminal domain-containing protein [Saccharibacillus sp. CPCC 101409]
MPYETTEIMLSRAGAALPRLREAIYDPIAALDTTAWVTREPVPYAERTSGTRKAIKPGDPWGELWDCAWFHFKGTVPDSAAGRKAVLLIDINGELCLFDEAGSPRQGLTNINSEFELRLGLPGKRVVELGDDAAGKAIDLWGDAGCNDLFGKFQGGGTMKEADIAICHEETRELYYDFEVLTELAEQLDGTSARRERIVRSLYEAALMLEQIDEHSVRRAKARIQPELDKRGGDPVLTVSAIGHAHIDLAWLWPIRETIRKGARTFSTVLRNMEKYPDYVFGASQPQLYQWMKDYYPKLYEQIRQRVEEGRWELQGAMWVEPDANISGGEALVRQILYGKRFFQAEFGQEMKSLWLPDVFGYTASLPQLLRKSGVDYMMTQKLSWSVYNDHPHHSFLWEGIDGSSVLTHLPPEDTYNSPAAPRSLVKIEQDYLDRGVSEHALMLFGIGDGGGGPGEEHLERLARERNLLGLPPVVMESSQSFFQKLEREKERFQTYRGELYLEKHQGTLTSQARNKRYNRRMEKSLRELEFAASLALALGGEAAEYPAAELERIWKETLLYQFHDILPGSSITRVFEESLERYAKLHAETTELIARAYDSVARLAGAAGGETRAEQTAGRTLAFNSLPWERTETIERGGERYNVTVPPMGFAPLSTAERWDGQRLAAAASRLHADGRTLENEHLRVAFGESGGIVSLVRKGRKAQSASTADRETIASGREANVLTVYHDRGDAWDFARDYRETVAGRMELTSSSARVEAGCAVLEQRYRFGESTLTQKIVLDDGADTLRFETSVDWRESGKMLRSSFPVQVLADHVSCEIQFGYLKRPTTRNTMVEFVRDEICAHQYIDLSQPDFGVALLSDSKYGYSAERNVLDINLLRSPGYPDPVADRAEHEFVYALYPHEGDHVQAQVYRRGYELNSPLTVQAVGTAAGTAAAGAQTAAGDREEVSVGSAKAAAQRQSAPAPKAARLSAADGGRDGDRGSGGADGAAGAAEQADFGGATPYSLIALDHPHIMVEAVKKAEDSACLIVRLYEASGTQARATATFAAACAEIVETDLMENPLRPGEESGERAKADAGQSPVRSSEPLSAARAESADRIELVFQPFEIKTLSVRLERG